MNKSNKIQNNSANNPNTTANKSSRKTNPTESSLDPTIRTKSPANNTKLNPSSKASKEDPRLYKRAPNDNEDPIQSADGHERSTTSRPQRGNQEKQSSEVNKDITGSRPGKEPVMAEQLEEILVEKELSTNDQKSKPDVDELINYFKEELNEGEEEKPSAGDQVPSNEMQIEGDLEMLEAVDPALISSSIMLACIERLTVAESEKRFFNNGNCLLCGQFVKRQFKRHMKEEIKGKKSTGSKYSLCMKPDGSDLQIQCRTCSMPFSKPTANALNKHSSTCNANVSNLTKASSNVMIDHNYELLEKKFKGEINTLTKKVTTLEEKLAKTEKKVTGVYRTQGTLKKRLDANDTRVATVEKNVETTNKKVDEHESAFLKLVKEMVDKNLLPKLAEPVTSTSVFNRLILGKKPVEQATEREQREREREKERERERSRERPYEIRTTRQTSRNNERERERRAETRERTEERRTRQDYKGGHSYQNKRWQNKRRN